MTRAEVTGFTPEVTHMPRRIAHKSSTAEGGLVRTVYRYDDLTTRTVLRDPTTDETTLEATGACRVDANGAPLATWWKPE